MPYMAIWSAAWPRTEGMTTNWYGPIGIWRWLAGLAPTRTWFCSASRASFHVERLVELVDRRGQFHQLRLAEHVTLPNPAVNLWTD
jgi:hypothetical protein